MWETWNLNLRCSLPDSTVDFCSNVSFNVMVPSILSRHSPFWTLNWMDGYSKRAHVSTHPNKWLCSDISSNLERREIRKSLPGVALGNFSTPECDSYTFLLPPWSRQSRTFMLSFPTLHALCVDGYERVFHLVYWSIQHATVKEQFSLFPLGAFFLTLPLVRCHFSLPLYGNLWQSNFVQ